MELCTENLTLVDHKLCGTCKVHKLFEHFTKCKSTESGLARSCKDCCREHKKRYREKNKDSINEKQRIEYEKNRDKNIIRMKEYKLRNKEKISISRKKYYVSHKEELQSKRRNHYLKNSEVGKIRTRDYYQKNKEDILIKSKENRVRNREKILVLLKKYRKQNPEKMNALRAKRRAVELKVLPSWAEIDKIKAIYKQAKDMTLTTGIKHVVDHIIPLQGKYVTGLHVHTNLRVITYEENARKHNKFLEELL